MLGAETADRSVCCCLAVSGAADVLAAVLGVGKRLYFVLVADKGRAASSQAFQSWPLLAHLPSRQQHCVI